MSKTETKKELRKRIRNYEEIIMSLRFKKLDLKLENDYLTKENKELKRMIKRNKKPKPDPVAMFWHSIARSLVPKNSRCF